MVNEFQHKGYAVLFGIAALVLTFTFWGLMPPFYWLSTALIFLYLGIQIGQGSPPGRSITLVLTALPLWVVAIVLSMGKPAPYVQLSLILISLAAGAGGMWLSGRTPKGAAFALQHLAWPLALSLLGMLGATLLMFVVSASGLWPFVSVPPYAILLPVVLSLCALYASRQAGRLWWRDALLIWVVPFLFFVIYRPLLTQPEPEAAQDFGGDDKWMIGATLIGMALTAVLSRITKNKKRG